MTIYRSIPVRIRPKDVFIRLGMVQKGKILADERMIERTMGMLPVLQVRGICRLIEVEWKAPNRVLLQDREVISSDFARYIEGCTTALLMAATLGEQATDRIHQAMEHGRADDGVILDAVASVAVDAGLDFMTRAQQEQMKKRQLAFLQSRYSPGYGDMDIRYQRTVFDLVGCHEIGMGLTQADMLTPEKSVLAILGGRYANG